MDELDAMHKRLDEEQIARNELKRSLKAAAEELEEWKNQQSSAGLAFSFFLFLFLLLLNSQ